MSGLEPGGKLLPVESLARRALEQLGQEGNGKAYLDPTGPALYLVGPQPVTFAACRPCQAVQVIMSIPVKPRLLWTHETCGRTYRLEPPLEVLRAGLAPA